METISRNIDAVLAFHTVAAQGSFTRAASELGTSKAMVSKQVMRLEATLGTVLFLRTTRTLNLTPAGETLFGTTQKIFGLSDEVSRRLRDQREEMSGEVRISMPASFTDAFAAEFLKKVRLKYPLIQVEIDGSLEVRDLKKREADFAIRASEVHDPDLIARNLGRSSDVICASPDFLKTVKLGKTPESLSLVECLLHSHAPEWNLWNLKSAKAEHDIQAKGHYSANQYHSLKAMCLGGLGVTRLPQFLVEEELKDGKLVQLYPEFKTSTHSYHLVYFKEHATSKKVKALKALILDWFSEHPEWFF
jgi:DNA-binding transcriptional LysR family regulator